MRGILFTEYLDFVSKISSEDTLEVILSGLEGKIKGFYTSVGNYSFDEFAILHVAVSDHLNKTPNQIAEEFGAVLLGRFAKLYPNYFEGVSNGLDFLALVGDHIHVEVKKLYPDAKPPEILLKNNTDNSYTLTYISHRPLAAVARGLTDACLAYFNDDFRIHSEEQHGNRTEFLIQKAA